MIKREFSGIPLWQFDILNRYEDIFHFVSGRKGGASIGPFAELNLSFSAGDDAEAVKENRERLATAIAMEKERLVFPQQSHSNVVKEVNSGISYSLECTDALVTSEWELCIAVMSADCVPVLIYDPENKVVASIHAGWKGTVAKIAALTVEKMSAQFGSQPDKLIAGIGPSISPDVYEVGEEVIAKAIEAFPGKEKQLLKPSGNNKACFNLWEANKSQLVDVGLLAGNIEIAGICTYTNSREFFSARAQKPVTGRFAAGIMLRKL